MGVIFLFSQKCITQCFKQKCIVTMFTCKDFMSDFNCVYCSILSKMVCTFFDDFL